MQLHELEKHQCAHYEKAEEYTFNISWNHEQVDAYLRNEVFKVPFGYVDALAGKGKGKRSCQWVLINKEKRYNIVPEQEPDGACLARFRGRPKCPPREASVIIGT